MEKARTAMRAGAATGVPGGGTRRHQQQGVKSVETSGRVLAALCAQNTASLTDLADRTRMPAAKLHRYLVSLIALRLVAQNEHTRRYSLGPFAIEIGAAAMRASDELAGVVSRLVELRNGLDETIAFSIWTQRGPVVIHVEESSYPVTMTVKVGTVLPILATAAGILFAALLPGHLTAPLLDEEFARKEKEDFHPIVRSRAALERLATNVRRKGYVFNKGHLLPGVTALAAPLFGRSGRFLGVVSAIGRESQISPARNGDVLKALLRVTALNE